ncbi:skin secretory protein xP2-like [Cydia pomonella]|uniref:skin secretory protein xP2-like n=1 Tax=Cydia pomonella TaxID=82600 RepID=UPI002ADE0D0D|nr:skin secretory protein xP2-like [Cydia pomonella]
MRCRKNKLIIDKETRLSSNFLRARIGNINFDLETRCKEFFEDIANLRVPAELLLNRPAHAGARFPCIAARALRRLFSRNLSLAAAAHVDQRTMEPKKLRCGVARFSRRYHPAEPTSERKENVAVISQTTPPRLPRQEESRPSDPELDLPDSPPAAPAPATSSGSASSSGSAPATTSGSASASGSTPATASGSASASGSAPATASGSASASGSAPATASGSARATGSASASGSGSAAQHQPSLDDR